MTTLFNDIGITRIDFRGLKLQKRNDTEWEITKTLTSTNIILDHEDLVYLYRLLKVYFGEEHEGCGSL